MKTRIRTSVVRGESLRGSKSAEDVIALDRENMQPILDAVGREFPEEKRLAGLFHPSNRIILAHEGQELVGYIDYRDDWNDSKDLYLSSIQIRKAFRGGSLFRVLVSSLLEDLRAREFKAIKTHIQKSNPGMLAMARKLGFAVEENPKSPGTLDVSAGKSVLSSSRVVRLFSPR